MICQVFFSKTIDFVNNSLILLICFRLNSILFRPNEVSLDFFILIIGPTISTYNLDIPYGQFDGIVDQRSNSRTASGDIKTDIGPKSKKLMFDLSFIGPEDRSAVKRVLENGIGKFMWVSLMAEDADPELERDKSIYGKLTRAADMQWANYASHTTQFELES